MQVPREQVRVTWFTLKNQEGLRWRQQSDEEQGVKNDRTGSESEYGLLWTDRPLHLQPHPTHQTKCPFNIPAKTQSLASREIQLQRL